MPWKHGMPWPAGQVLRPQQEQPKGPPEPQPQHFAQAARSIQGMNGMFDRFVALAESRAAAHARRAVILERHAAIGGLMMPKERAEVDGKKADDLEGGEPPAGAKTFGAKTLLQRKLEQWAPVIWQAFTLTFVAEWGDRSQIATIALASSKDPYGVTLGGTIGHGLCTGLAVIGGKLIAAKISERTVALAGGVLFWIFALHELWVGP